MSGDKGWIKHVIKALGSLLLIAGFLVFGLVGLLYFAFSRISTMPVFSVLAIILYVEVLIYLLVMIWKPLLLKKFGKVLLGISGAVIMTGAGFAGYYGYQNSIPTISEASVDLSLYEPYKEGSLVARLNNEESTLRIIGQLPKLDCATALYPVMSAFVQATYPQGDYSLNQNTDDMPIRQTNTMQAYQDLINGEVDMIIAAGPSGAQLAEAKKAGKTLSLTPIGKEAFVFFVNAKNVVDDVSIAQIQAVYSGELTNWKELGGDNGSIRAFQRSKDSGSQTALQRLMEGKNLMQPVTEDVAGGMGDIIEMTASYKNHKNALGYSFRYYCTEMVKNNQIKLLKIEGIYPEKETIRNGEYPISSEIYAVTAGTGNPNVQRLIDWILSPQGQWLIEQTGYVAIMQ